MEMFLGLLMLASWVYSIVIVILKVKDTNVFEKIVLVVALVGFLAYLLGTISA